MVKTPKLSHNEACTDLSKTVTDHINHDLINSAKNGKYPHLTETVEKEKAILKILCPTHPPQPLDCKEWSLAQVATLQTDLKGVPYENRSSD